MIVQFSTYSRGVVLINRVFFCWIENIFLILSHLSHKDFSSVFRLLIISFEMIPLSTNQSVLTWLCVHSIDATISKPKKLLYIIFTLSCLTIEVSALAASFVYFTKTVSSDFNESLHALFQIVAISGVIYTFVVALLMRCKISAYFETLKHICDASKTFI